MLIDNQPQHNSEEWFIDYSNPLGKGSFSDGVYKARKLNPVIYTRLIKATPKNGECAIKIISRKHFDKIGLEEIRIIDQLSFIRSCNEIIQYYGYGFSDNGELLYIYMEYLDGFKSLKEIIQNRVDKRLDEREIKIVFSGILKALQYLHQNNIIHRDIKCDNILYNEQTKQVKLIDFGISKYTQTKASTYCGTPTHMAPESRSVNPKTTIKSDIWSLGCTLIEMAGGDLSNTNQDGITPIIPNHLSNELIKSIQQLLTKDTFYRPNASLNHLEEYGYYSVKLECITLDYKDISFRGIPSTIKYLKLENYNAFYNLSPLNIPSDVIVQEIDSCEDSLISRNIFTQPSVKHLILTTYNGPITPSLVESNITVLELPSYNQPIEPNSIPTSIVSLKIPSFNHYLEPDSIPETLIALELGESFQFKDHGCNLPETLKILLCASHFETQLTVRNNIPNEVCILELSNYNQAIIKSSIPKTVSYLRLGSRYTHYESLANLPSSVITLTFNVDNLDNETQNTIQKFTPTSVRDLIVNNIKLR